MRHTGKTVSMMEEKVLEIFCQCRGFLKVDRVHKGYCVAYFEADFEMDKERLEKIGKM